MMNLFDEEKIEKELLKKLDSKNHKEDERKEKETIYESEYIDTDEDYNTDNIENHFDGIEIFLRNKNILNSHLNKEKIQLYSETFGEFKYNYNKTFNNHTSKFPLDSIISKLLLSSTEHINQEGKITTKLLKSKKIDLNFSDYFNYRVFKQLDSYSDFYLSSSDLDMRHRLMKVYIFHILNHVLKRKEEIEVNNRIEKLTEFKENKDRIDIALRDELFINEDEEFLKKYFKEEEEKNIIRPEIFKIFHKKTPADLSYENIVNIPLLDQGFTSPRVLILVPNKKHGRIIIEEILSTLRQGKWKGISNKKKFKEEYSETESLSDCFRMGISIDYFNNKMRLYQPFDSSDIILASPLGLKLSLQNNDESVKNKKVYDFLSSIEILLMDFSEVFLYQNTEHLEEILQFLNKTPKNNQNINSINRIKENSKEGILGYLRQNIVVSHFKSLEIEMLIKKHCNNLRGGFYSMESECESVIDAVNKDFEEENNERNFPKIKFEFKMLKVFDSRDQYEYKFNYFTKNLWQMLYDTFERHTVIFCSSTLDFIRLKSFFKKNSVSVTFISEDTDKKDWQRNRLFFEEGRYKFLLYSERAEFFKKINLKFAKNIFFYSLPEDPNIFKEMVKIISPKHYNDSLEKYKIEDKSSITSNCSAVIGLVTKMEKYNLEKVVGSKVFKNIIKNKLENFVY